MNYELISLIISIILGVIVIVKKREFLLGFGVFIIINVVLGGCFDIIN